MSQHQCTNFWLTPRINTITTCSLLHVYNSSYRYNVMQQVILSDNLFVYWQLQFIYNNCCNLGHDLQICVHTQLEGSECPPSMLLFIIERSKSELYLYRDVKLKIKCLNIALTCPFRFHFRFCSRPEQAYMALVRNQNHAIVLIQSQTRDSAYKISGFIPL